MIRWTRSPIPCLLAFVVLAIGCGDDRPHADPATMREIAARGRVVGTTLEDGVVHAWRGIPYAKPPVGPLRWRAPQPAEPWEGVREALTSGSPCTQLGGEPILGSEDCLYLDVYAPAMAADAAASAAERLPVMFWIHGGGNSMGWGDQLPPTALVRDNEVVVVTINYRLGIFGWLSHPALRASASGPEDASGNFGTLDMIRALEWVRDNIAGFGGDPDRVTIFGESAGGIDVFSLLVSPRAKGLFHGAIAESGAPTTMTRAQAEHYTDATDGVEAGLPGSSSELVAALLVQTGRADDREQAKRVAAGLSHGELEAMLRGLSAEALLAPFIAVLEDESMPIYITPTVYRDGHVVSDGEPLELFATSGGWNEVPVIAGTNREEAKLFFLMSSPHVSRTFGIPTGLSNERLYDVEGEYGGLAWRAMGADEPIAAMQQVASESVWAYRFDWDEEGSPFGIELPKLLGAAHAVEMLFVFGLQDLGWADRILYDDVESARVLSEQMRSYWANFAHKGRPGRGQAHELPDWAAWSPRRGAPKYLIFDSERDGGLEVGTDRIDQAFVLRRAAQDPRLLDDSERCRVYRNFVKWSEVLTPEAYVAIDDGVCADHPLGRRTPFPSLSHETGGDGDGRAG
ncbi:MAG: carboxylesterase family protein [Myxococcales bacterium]|nr:carboxylesterase family protein [Myxococcales bacterium]